MNKTKQNKVPTDFQSFYNPILKFKILLQSKVNELPADSSIQALMMMHFATFLLCNLNRIKNIDNTKILIVRSLIELMLEKDSFNIYPDQSAKLYSFIDRIGKELNTTDKAYLDISFYSAYLDLKIYHNFKQNLGFYKFKDYAYISPSVIEVMKYHHDVAVKSLVK